MTTKYNKDVLDITLKKDNASIVGEYNILKRDTIINFVCNCGKNGSKNFRALAERSGAFCKTCIDAKSKIKSKNTFLTKYGVEHPMKTENTKNKIKEIMLEKYGVENAFQNKDIKVKIKKSMVEKYGVEYPLQSSELQYKKTLTNLERLGVEHAAQNKDIIDKMKETNVERYGVENGMFLEINKNKIKLTNLERFGVEYAAQNKEVMDKMKSTHLERYGVEHPMSLEKNKNKIKETNLERYGVKHPLQNNEIMIKTQKNAKKYKEYTFPSGSIRNVQGYEPFALNDLLKIYNEDQIITNRKDIPRIKYLNNDKEKYYFPDIYIPHINKIIEVKSSWTYKCDPDIIKLKKNATELLGYDYEIWIYDYKGIKEVIECNK